MAKKPDLVVFAKSLTGHWKRIGVAWRNKAQDKERTGYLKIQLDFIPPSGELTLWNAGDRPEDLEPEERFDSRQDLAPTIVEEAG